MLVMLRCTRMFSDFYLFQQSPTFPPWQSSLVREVGVWVASTYISTQLHWCEWQAPKGMCVAGVCERAGAWMELCAWADNTWMEGTCPRVQNSTHASREFLCVKLHSRKRNFAYEYLHSRKWHFTCEHKYKCPSLCSSALLSCEWSFTCKCKGPTFTQVELHMPMCLSAAGAAGFQTGHSTVVGHGYYYSRFSILHI